MINKKISVIVPVYNVEKYAEECIKSIMEQTHKNLEVILINDGSTDSSPEICDKFGAKDTRIKVIHKKNEGVSRARNLGLQIASGDYIGFVDSDDWLEPNAYETMLRTILSEKSQMCVCTKYIVDNKILSNSNYSQKKISRVEAMKNLLNYNFPTSLWNGLYERDLLENMLLNEDIHHLEDLEYQFRILTKVDTISICNEAIYNYRQRVGSANHTGFNHKKLSCLNMMPIIEKYIKNDREIDNKYIYILKCRLILTVGSFIAKSNVKEDKYLFLLKTNARSCWLPTILSGAPYKKKILITLLSINPKLYLLFYKKVKLRVIK